ncbi:MAG TPA: pro-sigmaK processing inhibitor BofA [Firmicutes bacterium]|nr:pro-sigmaK processing inhibitor BofA [Bacillota bacterium]
MDLNINILIAYAFGLFLLYLIARLLLVPLKILLRLLYNALVGGVVLWVVNLVGGYFGVFIPINPITALVAGFLGVPGVVLLVLLQLLHV